MTTKFIPLSVSPIDCSGSIAAGGTAQTMVAANSSRIGIMVQNTSAGDLWINEVGTAAAASPSIKIAAGTTWNSPMTGCPTGEISIFGATLAQTFTARTW